MTNETGAVDASTDVHDGHATAHDHESNGQPLGEIDLRSWAAAIAGGGIGLAVALALFVASSG